MKFTLKVEGPAWAATAGAAAHALISGGGLLYLMYGEGSPVLGTATTLAVGASYGHMLTAFASRGSRS
ncbi:hypothetical protein [Actinomadura roseirufa]|uniref:hypothetical protein n=1 Tax=Actinomadura roseirufa TaxID=2094049 RepID=UPI001040E826|nr:hypothetical protein [Actinomadura roseirufa]